VFEHIESLGFGNVPAVVFNPTLTTPTLRFYAKGVADDFFQDIDIGDEPVSPERVREILDQMCSGHFDTPDGQIDDGSSIWADADKYWAASKTEAIIQAHMKTALKVALVGCNVRHEQPTSLGRIDLEIEQRSLEDGSWRRPIEIEVKVLRECGATGKKKSDL